MLKSNSTSSGLLFLSLSTLGQISSTVTEDINSPLLNPFLYATEILYNSPITSRLDEYVNLNYRTNQEQKDSIFSIDSSFMNVIQDLAKNQKEIDGEFVKALDELLNDYITSFSPSKKRF